MKAAFGRKILPVLMFCWPLIALAGCDDDRRGYDWSVSGILAIVYAVGDVVLAIVRAAT